MERKRDGLVPIAEALADLDGPVKAIRDATPQAVHHYGVTPPLVKNCTLRSANGCPPVNKL